MPPVQTLPAERQRIREALLALVGQRGYRGTTLEAVIDRAGVDRAAFNRNYPDLQTCFVELWEQFSREFSEQTLHPYLKVEPWRDGVRGAAWACCKFVQEDHDRARLFFIEFPFVDDALVAKRDVSMREYVDFIDRGSLERPKLELPRAKAEAIIGAIWEGVCATIQAGNYDSLPAVVPQSMYLAVVAYLGPEAAEEELNRGSADIARYEAGEL